MMDVCPGRDDEEEDERKSGSGDRGKYMSMASSTLAVSYCKLAELGRTKEETTRRIGQAELKVL
jgi:hypothetical protein